mgnify:FL=1
MQEAEFGRYVDRSVLEIMERQPVFATYMGIHTWDDRLADYSPSSMESFTAELRARLAELERVDASGFSEEGQIDFVLFTQLLKSLIRSHEKVAQHLTNPNFYLDEAMSGVLLLVMKEFAPLPERLRSALGRVREIPRLLAQARANLQPERVPRTWAALALEQAQMGPGLFQGLLPGLAKDVPDLAGGLREAGEEAAATLVEFARYLEEELLPAARGDFAVGEDLFNELLREDHMVDYDADELLETGWRLFRETEAQMKELAHEIDPTKTTTQILEEAKADHPKAEELLDTYRRAMESTRQFVIDHDIATIPEGERLTIVETPEYLRPLIPYAAYMPPGIFEEELRGFFLVTPVDPSSPAEEREQRLRGHHHAKLPVTALHEGYPGHHLQLVRSVSHGTTARKLGMMLSTLFIEGWAFYCEEMMEQAGYISTPIQRLARLSDQLWRAARIIIDVSLHCKGMSEEEAVDFLVTRCQLEPANAKAEVRRYTATPTQPQSYLMGKLEILAIVEEYKRRNPGASLREMHDAILACGSLPPRLMRRQLFGA